jgi:hypothetical protein
MLLILLVRFYQLCLACLFPASCRFHPSCSEYAIEALREHGAARGSLMAIRRLARCNPWHPGGVDAVPPAHRERCNTHHGHAHAER